MKHHFIIPTVLFATFGLSSAASAFTCFFTFVKDSCWTDYTVNLDVTNATTGKSVLQISVPKGKSWVRQQFVCEPGESFNFSATFSPIFWQSDAGKHFSGKRTWTLPQTVKKGDTAWNITTCYASDFSEVPLPPKGGAHCQCDYKSLPPVIAPEKP